MLKEACSDDCMQYLHCLEVWSPACHDRVGRAGQGRAGRVSTDYMCPVKALGLSMLGQAVCNVHTSTLRWFSRVCVPGWWSRNSMVIATCAS